MEMERKSQSFYIKYPFPPITYLNSSEATSEAENNDGATAQLTGMNQEDSEGSGQASPLLSANGLLFSDSPSKLKRKRMEELVERSQRKRT